jgi:hypothetical protein
MISDLERAATLAAATLARQSYGIATAGNAFGGPRGIWLECSRCPVSHVIVGSAVQPWPDISTADAATVFTRHGWTGEGEALTKARCPRCSTLGRWPADVTVPPPPMRGRVTAAPWPVQPRFIRWETALDQRARPFHDAVPALDDPFWDNLAPPRNLGRFNCRGDYVVPHNASPLALPGETEADTIERLLLLARNAHPVSMSHRCATCGTTDGHMPDCAENVPPDDDLPDGLWECDGRLYFECRGCERDTEWEGDPSDFELGHYANVCGGSPRCCP